MCTCVFFKLWALTVQQVYQKFKSGQLYKGLIGSLNRFTGYKLTFNIWLYGKEHWLYFNVRENAFVELAYFKCKWNWKK